MEQAAPFRVLVVEDDRATREALADLLRESGFAVAVADDGAVAADLAVQFEPAVILMDFGLPRLNGWETTLRLRRDARTSRIPIIALTGQSGPEALALAREVGCLAVMTKPVDVAELVVRLRVLVASPPPEPPVPLPGEDC
jgi:DNA-binding response OmpR family regulator